MMIEFKCPCCQKHIQLILSSNGDADDKVGVLSIKEKEDLYTISADELFDNNHISLGESEVNNG